MSGMAETLADTTMSGQDVGVNGLPDVTEHQMKNVVRQEVARW